MSKKIITLIIIVVLTGLVLPVDAFDNNNAIKSASELDYPPFSVVTKTGEADGFSVELLKATLNAVNLKVTFYVGPWDQIKQDLADGKIQVLPLVARSPERESIYDFTEPYLTFYGTIFVRIGDNRIKTVEDLSDKEIVVMKGDAAEEYVRRENVSKHIITTQTFGEAFQMLSDGKYDAVIAQQRMGTKLLRELDIKNVAAVDYRLDKFKQDFTFAVKEGDADLLATLDKGLRIVTDDGTFQKLYKKWFIETEEDAFSYWPIAGPSVMIIIFFILSGICLVMTKYRKTTRMSD